MADRDIPEEMVEAALLGAMGFDAVQDDDCPKDDAYFVAQMRAALSAALAGRTVLPEPELVELPKFQGCNNSNPDLCACNDSPLMCTVCDNEIEDGMQAFTVTVMMRPWLREDDPEQEWEHLWWHYTCDERPASGVRAAGSGVGDQT